jgi:hypothetical protein
VAATDKMHAGLSIASRARRGVFNASAAGKTNLLGDNELIDAVVSGGVDLDDLDENALPEALKPMARAEQEAFVADLAEKREDLQLKIKELSQDRSGYLAKKVDEAGGLRSSLDQKLYDAVKEQAGEAGLEYKDGPNY